MLAHGCSDLSEGKVFDEVFVVSMGEIQLRRPSIQGRKLEMKEKTKPKVTQEHNKLLE